MLNMFCQSTCPEYWATVSEGERERGERERQRGRERKRRTYKKTDRERKRGRRGRGSKQKYSLKDPKRDLEPADCNCSTKVQQNDESEGGR